MKIRVKDDLGRFKEVKLGYSWTMFFWGFLVPLVRGDWKHFFILLAISVIFGFGGVIFGASFFMLIFAFFYNKLYAQELHKQGYRGLTEEEQELFIEYMS